MRGATECAAKEAVLTSRRVLSMLFLALYLVIAGGFPIADAMLERGSDIAMMETAPFAPDDPAAPLHESCSLCTLIERPLLPSVAVQPTVDLPAVDDASGSWRDPAPLRASSVSSDRSARAPPAA